MAEIDVLMPNYNGAKYLEESLTSLLNQNFNDWRLIFVDDGSTDGSATWIANKAREDKGLCLLRLSRNFGHQIAIDRKDRKLSVLRPRAGACRRRWLRSIGSFSQQI